jgi:hypothetical protein
MAQLACGQTLALSYRCITNGRELRFSMETSSHAVHSARPPQASRIHAAKFVRAPSAEPPATGGPRTPAEAACARDAHLRVTSILGSLPLPASLACPPQPAARRRCEGGSFRMRRPRAEPPRPFLGARVPIDERWRHAMREATTDAIEKFGLSPGSGGHSVLLCEAALEIAANPGRFGVHPLDALQAARLYYAA